MPNKPQTTTWPEIPEGWFIESLCAEKIRVPMEDYECVLVHPERLYNLKGELSKMYSSGSTPQEALAKAIAGIGKLS